MRCYKGIIADEDGNKQDKEYSENHMHSKLVL